MQAALEMRTLRAFYSQKGLLSYLKKSRCPSLISCKYPQTFLIQRNIHSAIHRLRRSDDLEWSGSSPKTNDSENGKPPSVSTFYDPLTNEVVTLTQTETVFDSCYKEDASPKLSNLHLLDLQDDMPNSSVVKAHKEIESTNSDKEENSPKLPNLHLENDLLDDRSYGRVVKAQYEIASKSSDKKENNPKLSNLHLEDDLLDDRSNGSVAESQNEIESNSSDIEENSPKLSTLNSVDDLLDDRSYGSVLKAQKEFESDSSDKEENTPKLSTSQSKDASREDYRSDGSFVKAQKRTESDNSKEKSIPVKGYNDCRMAYGNAYSSNQSQFGRNSLVSKHKKGKVKTLWVCVSCGNQDGQWWGRCPYCKTTGTMKQFSIADSGGGKLSGIEASENIVQSWLGPQLTDDGPVRLTNVNKGMNQSDWRFPLCGLFGNEVSRVLGGGLVPGSLVLVGGDPGVGKSTLVLQIAAMIAEGHGIIQGDSLGVVEVEESPPEKRGSSLNGKKHEIGKPAPVVYVSGEESVEQIKSRADRMKIGTKELYLYSSTDIEDILDKSQRLSPRALVIDSIQTVYLKGVTGSAGSMTQVKECTSALLRFAKKTNIPVFLIGHVTKSGDIAGPRVLEHIVDAVLYMEVGETHSAHRLLRPVKNRFGSTDELGVFEMSQAGLQAVLNPSEMFLGEQYSDSEVLAGLAVAVIMDGSRPFLVEIQALCVAGPSISTQVNGITPGKASMIIAVLMKQAGLKLQSNAIFLNVVSGVTLKETAGDLAVAAAICSSFLEFPIPNGVAFIGEVGLDGALRMVPRMEKRVMTVAKLGYQKCVVPESSRKALLGVDLGGLMILGCRNLKDVINTVFIT